MTVEVATPFAVIVVVPEIDEFAATAEPDWNVTVPPAFVIGVLIESVFTSAVVDASVHVDVPAAVDELHVPYTLFVPVAENVGTMPETLLLFASLRVIVTVDVEVPSGFTGDVPVIVEFAATAAPAVNTIPVPDFATGVTIAGVLVSAFVDLSVHVEVPVASVTEQAV